MKIRKALSTLVIASTFVPVALAQRQVAPPPKPRDNGPSLAVTMQFIQEKLNALGTEYYSVFAQDTKNNGNPLTNSYKVENTNAVADPNTCTISGHFSLTRDSEAANVTDYRINLQTTSDVVVEPLENLVNGWNAGGGHPEWVATSSNPRMVALRLRWKNSYEYWPFADADMADRVAKAMTHAIELCGGGSKEPF